MKKVVRVLGLCALVALAFTSCKKDKQNEELKFMASITQPVNTSKTHIDNATNMLVWDANNTIKVFNANGVEGNFKTTDNDVVEATFEGTLPETSTYTAFYPNAAVNGSAVTLSLNANQTYVANNFGNDTYPMAANSTLSNDVYHFQFHSPASVLRLRLKSNNNCTVKTITMTGATGDKLAGDIVYSNFSDPTTCTFENTTNSVTLTAANGVQLLADEEIAFNLVVMSGSMSIGTQFVVKDMSNNVIATLTTTHANTLTAEHILVMPILTIDYELPNVITNAATNVTYQTATINGEYTFPAGAPVNACGFYWSSNRSDVENLVATTKVSCSTVATPMSYNLSGLTANTTYYFRAWGANSTGEVQGAVLSFTTGAAPVPTVTTNDATNVTSPTSTTGTGSATLNGAYNANGTTITEVGFYWGTTNNPTTKVTVASSTATPFAYNLTGLQPGTYYFKAYAKTTTEYYGVVKQFTINLPSIPGAFSTSPTRMVVFAHANLQYNCSPGASATSTTNPLWRFAEHQWDFLGEPTNVTNTWNRLAYYWKSVFDGIGTFSYEDLANMYTTGHNYLALYAFEYQNAPADFETSNYWMDLFCWGATGYDAQAEPWNVRRDFYVNGTGGYFKNDPYGAAMATFVWGNGSATQHPGQQQGSSYTQSWYLPNISNNTNMSDYDNNYDWGQYCNIYNPKSGSFDAPGTWRTLTGSYHGDEHPELGEWYYLMHCRTTANGQASVVNGQQDARWCKARINVNGTYIRGLILFPDVYEHPAGVPGPNNINRRGDITCDDAGNDYTVAQWEQMEALGAEFLPCAGTRYGWGYKEWCYDPMYDVSTVSHTRLLDRAYADNAEGYYWSSTSRNPVNAGDLRFISATADLSSPDPDIIGNVDGGNNYDRDLGCSVRLAKTVRE